DAGSQRGQAGRAAPAAPACVGSGVRERDELPARAHGPHPTEARARPQSAALLHHRARYGLSLRGARAGLTCFAALHPPQCVSHVSRHPPRNRYLAHGAHSRPCASAPRPGEGLRTSRAGNRVGSEAGGAESQGELPTRANARSGVLTEERSMKLTGAQALIKSLEMEGVEVMFGLPGGAILPVYDPLIESSIRHILVRHAQGAGHMADAHAHATGRPGVAMVTSGPAATNIVTPLCDASMDSI